MIQPVLPAAVRSLVFFSSFCFCENKQTLGSTFFPVADMLFFRMGPVIGCSPSVLAPPIPPWGTPSAAGVAGNTPCHPSISSKEKIITTGKEMFTNPSLGLILFSIVIMMDESTR